ncbi:MAG: tRNA threonylcarbamoyladenosine dehydratase [Sedimentisphaerales bacterium]|jgi:tRNA A37 threonylcarbamoyladenosine dehydratase|nr:tRNA threonylcarbamoyladenosine dehydratase [Sedimentisphaerales bacterium]
MQGGDPSDRFIRLKALIGEDGYQRLAGSFVVVVGLGAVGSYACESLARAGIGRLRLVDFDQVRYSNFNRQLLAIEPNLGMSKVQAAATRVKQINPDCKVEPVELFVDRATICQVIEGRPDVVIDAIDGLAPKVSLLAELARQQIPTVSSMGAALRTDPTRIRIGPLGSTSACPLARRIRKGLRALDVAMDRIIAVYSIEPLPPGAYQARCPQPMDQTFQRGRPRRPLGSLPTLTGIFGLTCGHVAIQILLGNDPTKPVVQSKDAD